MLAFDFNQLDWESIKVYEDRTLHPFTLDKIIIHYGGYTDPGNSVPHEMSVLRGWQNYHIYGRGWFDIAYCFATGNSGSKYRLRGFNRNGATSGDYEGDGIPENEEALSLVWIGGVPFEPTELAYRSMGEMILDVFSEYGEVPVLVHSDVKATGCPGDYWRAWKERKGWLDYDNTNPPPIEPPIEGEYDMRTIYLFDGYTSKGKEDMQPTVRAWQAILVHHGLADPKSVDGTCAIDGMYGPGSEGSTKTFQSNKGLIPDGIVGPNTWGAGVG